MPDDPRQQLLEVLLERSFRRGDFVLASGRRSNYYVDVRQTTLSGVGCHAAAILILDVLREHPVQMVGGMAMGACPLVTATSVHSFRAGHPLDAFYVLKEAPPGGGGRVLGPITRGARVALLEDTTTTGGSTLRAVETMREEWDADVRLVLTVVDRQEGAAELYEKEGLTFHSLFTARDLLEASPAGA